MVECGGGRLEGCPVQDEQDRGIEGVAEDLVASLEAGHHVETLDRRAGLEGVEQGGLCGVRLEVVRQGQCGARLK